MELSDSKVSRNQVLLLVNVRDVRAVGLFADDRDSVRVLGADAFSLRLAFLCLLTRRNQTQCMRGTFKGLQLQQQTNTSRLHDSRRNLVAPDTVSLHEKTRVTWRQTSVTVP